MPSCSTSSNIVSSINALNVSLGGSRLVVPINYVSGLTSGDVIRYDIATSGYTGSKADSEVKAEVFGVIENLDSTTNKFNVIIYGSITIDSLKLFDVGGGGGGGGNDIYFLSGMTAGKLQNAAPSDLDHIVKPIYQISPHGSYTGVIVNYLGYKLGGDVSAATTDEANSVGEAQIRIGSTSFDEGYVDASIAHELTVTDYPDFYERFGKQYGYVERLTASNTLPGGIVPNNVPSQLNSSYTGKVVSVDNANKYIYVSRPPNADLASTNKSIKLNGVSIPITASEVYSVYTPVINLSSPLVITAKDGAQIPITQTVTVGLKVKPIGVQVSIPTTIETNSSITANSFIVGDNEINIENYILNLNSRLEVLEERYNL
jgi:hypothetical protein